MAKKKKRTVLGRIKSLALKVWNFLKRLRGSYNRRMEKSYSASLVGMVAAGIALVVCVVTLFIPSYIGVADDGSLNTILQNAGLAYRASDLEQPVGAYFVREYERTVPSVNSGFTSHMLLVRIAMAVDAMFTADNLFDVRFLAAIYTVMYVPAVWFFTKQAAKRVKFASEGTVIGLLCAFFLCDVAYVSYFNSLYPEALWFIAMLYCAGLCLSFQRADTRLDPIRFVLLVVCSLFLVFSEQHCAIPGLVIAVFCLSRMNMSESARSVGILAAVSAGVLITASCVMLLSGFSRFTVESKLNAMTSGVLLESTDPEQTLSEFGIDPRFETLADSSCYSVYPLTLADNPELESDFYPHYGTADILLHYARHPASIGVLLEQGVKAAFSVRRDYCGNYEQSAGMPERSRTPIFALASNFRIRSAPKTMGYIIVLAVAYVLLLTKRNTKLMSDRARSSALGAFWTTLMCGILHTIYIIAKSGTSEFARYCLIFSVCIDIVSIFVLCEVLHRLNLLETTKEEKK